MDTFISVGVVSGTLTPVVLRRSLYRDSQDVVLRRFVLFPPVLHTGTSDRLYDLLTEVLLDTGVQDLVTSRVSSVSSW